MNNTWQTIHAAAVAGLHPLIASDQCLADCLCDLPSVRDLDEWFHGSTSEARVVNALTGQVGGVCGLGLVESAEVDVASFASDAGPVAIASLNNAQETRTAVRADALLVLSICRRGNGPEVFKAVVRSNAVDVVDDSFWPAPMSKKPRSPVSFATHAANTETEIALPGAPSGVSTGARTTIASFPAKKSSGRVIGNGTIDLFKSELVLHSGRFRWLCKLGLPALNGSEVVDQRLDGLNAWVLAAAVKELTNEAGIDAGSFSNGVEAGRSCILQLSLQVNRDGLYLLHWWTPYRVRYEYAIPLSVLQ